MIGRMRVVAICLWLMVVASLCDAADDSRIKSTASLNTFDAGAGNKREVLINGEKALIWASSELASNSDRYSAVNAFDGNPATAWCEGAESDGFLESLSVVFEEPVLVSSINVINGYQKSEKTFRENNRAKRVSLESGALLSGIFDGLELGDGLIQVNKRLSTLKLTINDVEHGEKYNDLCFSEIVMNFGDDTVASKYGCTDFLRVKEKDWAHCINNNKLYIVPLTGAASDIAGVNPVYMLDKNVASVRLEHLADFVERNVHLFRLIVQRPYDRDYFLHFVDAEGHSLLLFHQGSLGDDGDFGYDMIKEDINHDGLLDASFKGRCDYPDGCPEFEKRIEYLSRDGQYLSEKR